jgi:hypothetical protein
VVLAAVPNTDDGLIENLFLLRKPHTTRWMVPRTGNSGISLVFREMWGATVGRPF